MTPIEKLAINRLNNIDDKSFIEGAKFAEKIYRELFYKFNDELYEIYLKNEELLKKDLNIISIQNWHIDMWLDKKMKIL